ncbi:unnamed protein product [Moneuplotes crassus]|uniref:Uncharacterized protein n=1 Tax=Euplotes crassus TaxID=5936 RepID=A0AAD2D8M0_EUPCR|nr:unnamed protein product [Moneuplotes crassus]
MYRVQFLQEWTYSPKLITSCRFSEKKLESYLSRLTLTIKLDKLWSKTSQPKEETQNLFFSQSCLQYHKLRLSKMEKTSAHFDLTRESGSRKSMIEVSLPLSNQFPRIIRGQILIGLLACCSSWLICSIEMFRILRELCDTHCVSLSNFCSVRKPLVESAQQVLDKLSEAIKWRNSRKEDLLKRISKYANDPTFSVRDARLLRDLVKLQSQEGDIDFTSLLYYFPGKTTEQLEQQYLKSAGRKPARTSNLL